MIALLQEAVLLKSGSKDDSAEAEEDSDSEQHTAAERHECWVSFCARMESEGGEGGKEGKRERVRETLG